MKFILTKIPDVIIIEPQVFGDERGFFFESWNRKSLQDVGLNVEFVQDNHSKSQKNVLRGLHYQIKHSQGKLIRVIAGSVFDVAVDLRKSSQTFGYWVSFNLSAENKRMAWIPPGFAHGFCVTSESAEFLYKTTDYWYPEYERTLLWCDPGLAIDWPLHGDPILAKKDSEGKCLSQAEVFCDETEYKVK